MKVKQVKDNVSTTDRKKLGNHIGTLTLTINCYEGGASIQDSISNERLDPLQQFMRRAVQIAFEQMEKEHNQQKTGTPS